MKIGMLVDTYLPDIGGAEVHVHEISSALRDRDHELEICTASSQKGEMDVGQFPVLRFPNLAGGSWRAVLNIPTALPKLTEFIRRVDIVHCHYSFLFATLGVLLGRIFGKRTLVTLHGLGTLDSSVSRSSLYRLYRYVSMTLAHVIIATSEEMRRIALRFAPEERILLIPNGVATDMFIPRDSVHSRELVILSMRRLAPKNGVQYLIEAAPEIIRSIPRARFWITGEGKLEDHIQQRVAELGLDEYVRFLGIVAHENTVDYYRQADIVVFPSSAESTSLACLEAMSMEKAVVASGLAVYRQMLGDGERGVLVDLFGREDSDYDAPLELPDEQVSSLAQAIIRLAKDEPLRRRLGQAARQHTVGHYDWKMVAEKTDLAYTTA